MPHTQDSIIALSGIQWIEPFSALMLLVE